MRIKESQFIKRFVSEYPYSQIIYPNQPYQLLILYNKKDIYRFESNILIPKDILKNSNEFDYLLKGVWVMENGDY